MTPFPAVNQLGCDEAIFDPKRSFDADEAERPMSNANVKPRP
jgi:hypothetical protein